MSKLVVVIDDERPIRDLVSTLLTEEGWPVRAYGSASDALRDIEAGHVRPDVVLLDMRMPGMDGPEFAAAVRLVRPDILIVVMTAARDAREWTAAIDAAGCLPKPFDIDWLVDTVTRVIGEPEGDVDREGTLQVSVPSVVPMIRGLGQSLDFGAGPLPPFASGAPGGA